MHCSKGIGSDQKQMAAPVGTAMLVSAGLACALSRRGRRTLTSFAGRNEIDRRMLPASVDLKVELVTLAFVQAVEA